MDNISEGSLEEMEKETSILIETLHALIKSDFCDVIIDCLGMCLPAHKYVLSFRSTVLAEQLSSGVHELNWTGYKANISIALLRWIYTDKIVLDNDTLALDLLSASHHFQLASLFETCERALITSVNEKTSLEFHDIAKKVGAAKLVEKCLEFSSISSDNATAKLEMEMEIDNEVELDLNDYVACGEHVSNINELTKRLQDLSDKVKKGRKLSNGYFEFRTFSDTMILTSDGFWQAHAYFLSSRSETIHGEIDENDRINFIELDGDSHTFLRWLYTDFVVLDNDDVASNLLNAAHKYQIPTLFEQCEEALVKTIHITSCAKLHVSATKVGAQKILKHCKQLMSFYWNDVQSQDWFEMDVDVDSMPEMTVCEPFSEGTGGLLTLNDDCLLHVLRFISLVDLGNIKDTCERFCQLADRSFKLRKDKSLTINRSSMFADIWNLKHFGKLINYLNLQSLYTQFASYEKIFEIIAEFSTEHLKSFILVVDSESILTDESFKCLEKIVKNVEIIKLSYFNDNKPYELLLSYCENLKNVDIDGDGTLLTTLCSKNKNMRCMFLSGLLNDDILEEISEKLIHLEHLVYECSEETNNKISHLGQMKNLQILKIRPNDNNIGTVLQNFANKNVLEYLCLSCSEMSETLADALSDFPNLKELVFEKFNRFDGHMLYTLSKKLVNIEKLAFIDCDEITFEDITKIIQNHLNLKELSVYRCDSIESIDRRSYLHLSKKRNLEIFLDTKEYESTIKSIGNKLSNYVRITAKPSKWDFFS